MVFVQCLITVDNHRISPFLRLLKCPGALNKKKKREGDPPALLYYPMCYYFNLNQFTILFYYANIFQFYSLFYYLNLISIVFFVLFHFCKIILYFCTILYLWIHSNYVFHFVNKIQFAFIAVSLYHRFHYVVMCLFMFENSIKNVCAYLTIINHFLLLFCSNT